MLRYHPVVPDRTDRLRPRTRRRSERSHRSRNDDWIIGGVCQFDRNARIFPRRGKGFRIRSGTIGSLGPTSHIRSFQLGRPINRGHVNQRTCRPHETRPCRVQRCPHQHVLCTHRKPGKPDRTRSRTNRRRLAVVNKISDPLHSNSITEPVATERPTRRCPSKIGNHLRYGLHRATPQHVCPRRTRPETENHHWPRPITFPTTGRVNNLMLITYGAIDRPHVATTRILD